MNELKTLKDFECNCWNSDCHASVPTNKLRQEAIKWVKAYRSWNNTKKLGEELAVAFMLFFNLTEEDLKT